jgi:hypothetical protein
MDPSCKDPYAILQLPGIQKPTHPLLVFTIIFETLKLLDPNDLLRAGQVCRLWNYATNFSVLQRALFMSPSAPGTPRNIRINPILLSKFPDRVLLCCEEHDPGTLGIVLLYDNDFRNWAKDTPSKKTSASRMFVTQPPLNKVKIWGPLWPEDTWEYKDYSAGVIDFWIDSYREVTNDDGVTVADLYNWIEERCPPLWTLPAEVLSTGPSA